MIDDNSYGMKEPYFSEKSNFNSKENLTNFMNSQEDLKNNKVIPNSLDKTMLSGQKEIELGRKSS